MITKIKRRLKQVGSVIRAFRKVVRDGGVTYVKVAQISRGEVLRGKTALVTGGSRGIGLEIAKRFLAEGAAVVITGRNAEHLKAASDAIHSPALRTIVWDIADLHQMKEKLADSISVAGGSVDIVVNNAGVFLPSGLLETAEETWDTIINTNAKGPFFLCQAISKYWIGIGKGGKLLNVASSGGFLGATEPYRMSKWSLVGMTRGFGLLLYPRGIIVNGIAPGRTSSDMLGYNADDNAYVPDYPPSCRVARAEEIAELALFLASDAANYIVGQTIICDGGYSLRN
jgi:3-oxoacyl-[acyl-carrier protein] reductase